MGSENGEGENLEPMEGMEEAPADKPFEFSPELRDYIIGSSKNPISLFTELHRAVFKQDVNPYCRCVPSNDPNKALFVFSLYVGADHVTGMSLLKKKEAKTDCYFRGLQVLFDKYMGQTAAATLNIKFGEETTMHELIRQLTYAQFSNLVKENHTLMDAEKVIASIFMFNATDRSLNIVSLATGNKCIKGDSVSLYGESVNDCHAEILARRGLQRFLYSQVMLHLRAPEKSIFIKADSVSLALRPSLSFHLFINTAPCGDARVYDRGAPGAAAGGDNENAGKMRFKVENGMGTVLGEADCGPQTMDGILGGERLRTMSCTDKILRWNYVGLQGALLSRFIRPVYLSSVTIGDALEKERLQRGLSGRLDGIQPFFRFTQNIPQIGLCQPDVFTHKCDKNLNIAVNWNVADDSIEVVNTYTGRVSPFGGASRLSRRSFAETFKAVCSVLGKPVPDGYTYRKLKFATGPFVEAQKKFLSWLEQENLGQWQHKPAETSEFFV